MAGWAARWVSVAFYVKIVTDILVNNGFYSYNDEVLTPLLM